MRNATKQLVVILPCAIFAITDVAFAGAPSTNWKSTVTYAPAPDPDAANSECIRDSAVKGDAKSLCPTGYRAVKRDRSAQRDPFCEVNGSSKKRDGSSYVCHQDANGVFYIE